MGVSISDIIPRDEINLENLSGRTLAIDAMNTIYQFLTTIRQYDGTTLVDSKGNVTSHLSGIFYRNLALLEEGIKPIYVFDGKPSELKNEEIERRRERKEIAMEKYESAKSEGDIGGMKKYSQQTVKVDSEVIRECKELLSAMGILIVDSINEGEAEAASLVKKGISWAAASQDYDSLLYGAPRLIRNLTLSRKRRLPSGITVDTKIEIIELQKVLNHLQIDLDQLICIGILVGTDFNPGGVRGIGQMKALEIVRKNKYPVKIFEFLDKSEKYSYDFDWSIIFKEFKSYRGNTLEENTSTNIDFEKIREILTARDFSKERIENGIDRLKQVVEKKKQKGLSEFF